MELRRWGVETNVWFYLSRELIRLIEGLTLEMSALESLRWPNYLMDAFEKTKHLFKLSFFCFQVKLGLIWQGRGSQYTIISIYIFGKN